MKKSDNTPNVLFNASVILAGLKSPAGGSGVLLKRGKIGIINAFASEIILDEVARNISKIGTTKSTHKKSLKGVFIEISLAPESKRVNKYKGRMLDVGDAHLFATAVDLKVDYLVSLDKKHVLSLKKKFRKPKIVNPGEMIEILSGD